MLSARKLARIAVELRSEPDPLVKACRASGIGHTVEKSNNSTRMMMMKGWRDVVLKVREAHLTTVLAVRVARLVAFKPYRS